MFTGLVNGANVGMIQRRRSTRLTAEPFERERVLRYALGKELERNETSERSIFGFVNYTHAAAAQLFDDTVMRDGFANHCWWGEELCYGLIGGESIYSEQE